MFTPAVPYVVVLLFCSFNKPAGHAIRASAPVVAPRPLMREPIVRNVEAVPLEHEQPKGVVCTRHCEVKLKYI